MEDDKYPYVWKFRKFPIEGGRFFPLHWEDRNKKEFKNTWGSPRKGQRCRVLARGRGPGPRNVLVEFPDGYRVVGTRYCVSKVKQLDLFNDFKAKGKDMYNIGKDKKTSERLKKKLSEKDIELVEALEQRIFELEKTLAMSEQWRKVYQSGKKKMIKAGGELEQIARKYLPSNEGYLDMQSERLIGNQGQNGNGFYIKKDEVIVERKEPPQPIPTPEPIPETVEDSEEKGLNYELFSDLDYTDEEIEGFIEDASSEGAETGSLSDKGLTVPLLEDLLLDTD